MQRSKLSTSALLEPELAGIQEQFAGWLREHVLTPNGEFYDPINFDMEFHGKMAPPRGQPAGPSNTTAKPAQRGTSGTSSKKAPPARPAGKDTSRTSSKQKAPSAQKSSRGK